MCRRRYGHFTEFVQNGRDRVFSQMVNIIFQTHSAVLNLVNEFCSELDVQIENLEAEMDDYHPVEMLSIGA